MPFENLESWQLEELSDRFQEMVGFFHRLQKRMDENRFPRDRMYEVVTDAGQNPHALGPSALSALRRRAARERDKFGERKQKPR